jgi:hypothetical protein
LGLGTGDYAKYGRRFWEVDTRAVDWEYAQGAVKQTLQFGGHEDVLYWDHREGRIKGMSGAEREQIHNQDKSGSQAWGKPGVTVSLMGDLNATRYEGQVHDKATAAVVPYKPEHLPAIWEFCASPEFHVLVQRLDQKIIAANATLLKVPFDLAHWQKVAEERYPNGLPEPYSDDPTQWLFHGHPKPSTDPLQVAVARLVGYRWPAETDEEMELAQEAREWIERAQGLNEFADEDGLVCLPAVGGEPAAEERLRAVLAAAWAVSVDPTDRTDDRWSPSVEARLLAAAGAKDLGAWLRDLFFKQHCKLFHNRPFVWHLWDGRRDGFSVLVNYHKLDRAKLERLTYTYLGDWIARQQRATDAGESGAEGRLIAARELEGKLKAILHGEPPYDLYVRWKPLHEQPLGWEPDLNDGVRLNIRPFVEAGILRSKFTINWSKDRGKNPDGSDRINDIHLTRAVKEAARASVG